MLTAWARDPDGGRLAAAGACALAACVGAWAARRSGAPAGIYLARAGEHDVQDRRLASVRLARRPLAPGAALTLVKARAEHIGASRIVLRAGARRAVVWRDATDADTYRRLAVRLRWAADVR